MNLRKIYKVQVDFIHADWKTNTELCLPLDRIKYLRRFEAAIPNVSIKKNVFLFTFQVLFM